MRNFKIVVQYDGTRYQGWQRQGSTENTLQGKFETLLSRIAGAPVEINASGRTDAGVHAYGQAASFHMDTDLSPEELLEEMNRYLPEDVAVLSCEEAAELLTGRHDFASFTSAKSKKKSTVRTISSIGIEKQGEEIVLTFTGDGFLYHMVRILTGTLVETGLGKRSADDMVRILEAKDRQRAGALAPACGLALMEVYY